MADPWTIFLLLIVGLLWGITNPFMKKSSIGIEDVKATNFFLQIINEIKFLASQPTYAGSFLINQLGSVLFMYALSFSDLSLAVPLTSSLAFLTTTLTGQVLGEEQLSKTSCLGASLVCAGIGLCVFDKTV